MSTILKALRRVEEERPAVGGPPRRARRGEILEAGKMPPSLPRKKRSGPNFAVWGGLAAALLLVALVWWRLPKPEPLVVEAAAPSPAARAKPEAAATRRTPAERLARRTEPPSPAPAAAPPEAPAPAAAPGVAPELAERLPALGTQLEPAAEPPAAEPPREPAAAAPARVAPRVAAEPPPREPPRATPPDEPAPRAEVETAARAALVPAPRAEPPPAQAPLRAAMPSPPPAPSAPLVVVERTSWHPTPSRRVAWVLPEGSSTIREVHEGDAVGALVVKEIRPSSVVFQHGAEALTRRVGQR